MTSLGRQCVKTIYAGFMLIIVTSSLTFGGETGPDDPRQIKGDVWGKVRHDTLFVRFDIRTDHFIADSMFILKNGGAWDSTAVWKLIHLSPRSSSEFDSLDKAIKLASRSSVCGVDTFVIGAQGTWCGLCFRAKGRDGSGQKFEDMVFPAVTAAPGGAILGFNYGYGHYGGLIGGKSTDCFISGLTVGGTNNSTKRSISVEVYGSFGGPSESQFGKWGAEGKFTYFTGDRTNYLPAPFAGVEFTRLSVKTDGLWVRRSSDLGGVVGVGLHGRFERLAYTYHTTQHGFHDVQLFMAVSSAGESRVGTVFRLEANKNLLTVGLALRAEGLDADGVAIGFHRFENRPWWHRALSYASIAPFMPLVLIGKAFQKHDE